jgi:tape measure domain-containing protein
MARMSLDTAIRLSAEVKGGGNIDRVKRSLQDLAKGGQTTAREMQALRSATFQFARANDGTIAGIRNSVTAFRGLQEQAKIGSREFQRYGSEIQRLEGKLRGLDGTASQTNARFTGMAAAAGRLIAAYAGIEAVRFVFGNAAELQSQTRSLEVLTGSADRAKQIVEELQQLGAVTPFTSTELIDTAKRLQAFGVETEQVVDITKRLADVSGATGAELAGLATAYGQVQAKGRLQGEELLQFQERGVALQEVLRKEYGLTGTEFQKALEKGQISAEAVEYALKKLTDSGGKYANGAIAQSDTLNGRLSTLTDSTQVLAQTIGNTLEPVFKWALSQATAVVGEIQRMIDEANNAGGAKDREAQFANNANAAVRAMGLNPFTQQGMMADMRQRNIEQQRADYDLSRQRARSANNAPTATARPPLSGNAMGTPIGATVGGGGGGGSKPTKPSEAEINRRALLATIRFAEGTSGPKGYGTHFGGSYTAPGGPHPNKVIRAGGYASAAFGAYQFMPDTWRGAGGGNMTPARQDEAALRLIRNRGVNPDEPLTSKMIDRLAPEWASLPTLKTGTSYYGQGGKSFSQIQSFYRQQVAKGGGDVESIDLKAGEAQAEAAERMREQLKAAESINVALKDRLAIAQTMEPVARQMLEYEIEQNQLAREYQDLKDKAAGPDELILINANLIIEQRIKQIEHEEKLNSLLADRAVLMANVAAQAAMPTVYNELETQEAALQAVLDKYPAIGAAADAAATLATSGVSEMIAGTKDAEEVFVDFLGSIADALMDTAKQMIAQYIAIGIAKMFAGMGNSVATDSAGWNTSFATPQSAVGTGFNFDAGAMTGGMPWSFAGGGYTGSAPRAGGIDGQGGFPAILHPQETVIDHTRAMPVPYQRAAAAAAPPAMEVPYQRSGPTLAVPFQKSAGSQSGDSMNAPIDVKFETVRIGGVDYVTRDEAEQIGRQSAQRGADLAHKRYRNSPSARRAVGFS